VREKASPHYDLEAVRELFRVGDFMLPVRVRRNMRSRGLSRSVLEACVAALDARDFHKSQAHTIRQGVWLDIYRPWVAGERMYLKFTEHEDGLRMLVLAFCVDSTAH
jgi:hypothetical protein